MLQLARRIRSRPPPALPVIFALVSILASTHATESFIPLPTELKISAVTVSMRAPLGLRYRPGIDFPLEIHVENPGSALKVDLLAMEGSDGRTAGDWAERTVIHAAPLPSGISRFLLPMRAPGVAANITLILRGAGGDDAKAELFRASLSPILRPLPPGGRVVLVCGGGMAPRGPRDETSRLPPSELPSEDWMWQSVDWVVLNDRAILETRPEARDALHRWLLGGGRLFLGSHEALTAAVNLNWLPINQGGVVNSDVIWWEKNAGLKKADILASKNFRPVYARLHCGFGQTLFLFPGSEASDADGAAVFNRTDLQRLRPALPDARIHPDRFRAFVSSAPNVPDCLAVMLWSLIGALILCAGLFYARSSRSKIEAFLLPFGTCALLALLLAKGFPRVELRVSHIRWEQRSAAGDTLVQSEWAFLESVRQPMQLSARGPKFGTLAPRFDSLGDLRAARLERGMGADRMTLDNIMVAPTQPVLLYSTHTKEEPKPSVMNTELFLDENKVVRIPMKFDGIDARRAIWVRSNTRKMLTQHERGSQKYDQAPYDARALEVVFASEMDSSLAKARVSTLLWAMDEAAGRSGSTLIFWNAAPSIHDPLIVIAEEGTKGNNDFIMNSFELDAEFETAAPSAWDREQ